MDKVCYNGKYVNKSDLQISIDNRGIKYGDSFFETIRCINGKPLFWEEHYFRIAGSFFLMKMNVPANFDLDFFKNLIQNLLIHNKQDTHSSRVRITFFRSKSGYYLPETNDIDFIIDSEKINSSCYELNPEGLKILLYKENVLSATNLSSLKSSNRLLNVLAAIYAQDNNCDDAILMNNHKNIVESTCGNIFICINNSIITPPIQDGCINGIVRKVLLNEKSFDIKEKSISLSDVFNAQEIFITNVIKGVRWIGSIDNKSYKMVLSETVLRFLNKKCLI